MKALITLLASLCQLFSVTGFGQDKILYQKLDSIIQIHMEVANVPALSFGIVQDGQIAYQKGYGKLSRNSSADVSSQTYFQIASVSKTFTGIITNHLIEEGRLDLNDKIVKYLKPYLKDASISKFSNITLKHLVEHTAGIPNFGCTVYQNWKINSQWSNGYSQTELMKDMNSWKLEFEPGSKFEYSNSGYALLGFICEIVGQKNYAGLVKQYITEPLQMNRTKVTLSKKDMEDLTKPYRPKYRNFENSHSDFGMTTPASGLFSCTNDLLVLLQKQLHDYQQFLNGGNRSPFVLTDQFDQEQDHYRLGLEKKFDSGLVTYNHSGSSDGYVAEYIFIPEKNCGVVIQSSIGGKWFWDLYKTVMQEILNVKPSKKLADILRDKINQEGISSTLNWYSMNMNNKSTKVDMEAMRNLSYEFIETNRYSESVEIIKIMMALFPNDKNVIDDSTINFVCQQLIDLNMISEAESFLKLNKEVHSNSFRTYNNLAKIALKKNDDDLAEKNFKLSIENNPRTDFLAINLMNPSAYVPTEISSDTTSLFEIRGDANNDVAFICVQGGPMPFQWIDDDNPLVQMPDHDQLLKVYPYQSQMLNYSILTSANGLTDEQSDFEHHQSVEILDRTIKYFKNQGKKIFLFVHSYGGMITLDYLNTKINMADKIVMMGMNFDMDLRNYREREVNTTVRWKDDQPVDTKFFMDLPKKYIKQAHQVHANIEQLVTVHGRRRYTDLLKDKDLTNLMFVHASSDESIGPISDYEVDFLQMNGVKFIETFGDHHSMMTKDFMHNMYDHLINGNPIKEDALVSIVNDLSENGSEYVLDNYKHYLQTDLFHPFSEFELNNIGYEFVAKGELEKALALFEINTYLYPNSWNAFDSFGEANMSLGNNKEAIFNYEKSLELNPQNTYAIEALKKLKD